MYDYEHRTYIAILNEFVPEWRRVIRFGATGFVALWMQATGQNEAQGYRWYHRAASL